MVEINPPVRNRIRPTAPVVPAVAINPPARTRIRPVAPPPPTNPWLLPPGARPLGVLQRTHNGYNPENGETPDPRFKPLLIVMPRHWRKNLPGYVSERFLRAIALTPETCATLPAVSAGNDYITEWALRHHIGVRSLSEDVYAALRARIRAVWDIKGQAEMLPSVQRGMLTLVDDGDILVDLNKNSGPYYCESALGIEHNYKTKLTPMQRGAT